MEYAQNTHIQESVFSFCFLRVAESEGTETKSDNRRTAKLLAPHLDTF